MANIDEIPPLEDERERQERARAFALDPDSKLGGAALRKNRKKGRKQLVELYEMMISPNQTTVKRKSTIHVSSSHLYLI